MGKFLRIVNGVPRQVEEASTTTIYNQSLTVVSGTPGANEIQWPIIAGTSITIPASQSYTGAELLVRLNGEWTQPVFDYNYVGSPPRTQISMTFDLEIGDRLDFGIYRGP